MEAINGITKNVKYDRLETCQKCKGKGGKNGTGYINCTQCRGSGIKSTRRGNVTYGTTCLHCGGKGIILKDPCK